MFHVLLIDLIDESDRTHSERGETHLLELVRNFLAQVVVPTGSERNETDSNSLERCGLMLRTSVEKFPLIVTIDDSRSVVGVRDSLQQKTLVLVRLRSPQLSSRVRSDTRDVRGSDVVLVHVTSRTVVVVDLKTGKRKHVVVVSRGGKRILDPTHDESTELRKGLREFRVLGSLSAETVPVVGDCECGCWCVSE